MARAFELMRLHNLTGQYFPTNESMVWSSPTVQVCMYYAIRIQTPVAECSCPNGKAEASVKLPILLQHLTKTHPGLDRLGARSVPSGASRWWTVVRLVDASHGSTIIFPARLILVLC